MSKNDFLRLTAEVNCRLCGERLELRWDPKKPDPTECKCGVKVWVKGVNIDVAVDQP